MERRANKLHPTCLGNGDGMYAEETRSNTGSMERKVGRFLRFCVQRRLQLLNTECRA